MENNSPTKRRRRDILKSVGVSTIILGGFSSTATALSKNNGEKLGEENNNRDLNEINTKFNPDSQKQVYKFARQISGLDEDEGIQVVKSLTRPRKEAYIEAMKPTEFNTKLAEVESVSDITVQDAGGRAYTATTTAKSPSGLVAYKYEVTVNFGWDDNEDEITTLDASAGPVTTGLPWRYRGEATDIVSNNDSSGYVKQTGDFGMCVFVPACVIVDERNPTISLRVYPGGEVDLLTKDNDK
jgi:hypothetical protein